MRVLGPPPLDYGYAVERITMFLRYFLEKSHARGYVVGVSGGVDSATTLALAVKAVGSERVHALVMPDPRVTPEEDVEDAVRLCRMLGVEYTVVDISRLIDSYASVLPFFEWSDRIATGNLRARIRMTILYYYANRFGYAVLGTGDKSEILLGYFTKYGDGGVDLLPIGDVYKTQVRRMAVMLGVPEKIAYKPSSPRLWPGHMAEEELGYSYELIDNVLYRYVDQGMTIEEVADELGVDVKVVRDIVSRVHANEHKRLAPLIPRITGRCIAHTGDWRMPWRLDWEV